jgi:putative ABC transport system permease protein
MGLFGLASLSAQQRRSEIGLRKVLGASSSSIVRLLSGEVIGLVLAAFILVAPVVYVAADRWLEGFAHRIAISWSAFLLAGGLALLLAWLTVSYQALRAAAANPVAALKRD